MRTDSKGLFNQMQLKVDESTSLMRTCTEFMRKQVNEAISTTKQESWRVELQECMNKYREELIEIKTNVCNIVNKDGTKTPTRGCSTKHSIPRLETAENRQENQVMAR